MTATAPAAPAADQFVIPDVFSHPKVLAARENLGRLAGERDRLDRELGDLHTQLAESKLSQEEAARRIVAGATFASVRQSPADGYIARLTADLRVARQAVDIAQADLKAAEDEAATELARQFAPAWRAKVREATLVWLEWVRASHEMETLASDLGPIYSRAGCEYPLPRLRNGDPASIDSTSYSVVRDLIEMGALDERADADLLADFAFATKPRPYVPPVPPPKKQPTEEGRKFSKMLRSLGVTFGLAGEA